MILKWIVEKHVVGMRLGLESCPKAELFDADGSSVFVTAGLNIVPVCITDLGVSRTHMCISSSSKVASILSSSEPSVAPIAGGDRSDVPLLCSRVPLAVTRYT
jgi:hypothetical protein